MKTKYLFVALATMVLMVISSCKKESAPDVNDPVPVSEVVISQTEAEIPRDGSLQLTFSVEPDNAEYELVEWKSSAEEIAVVDDSGLVTAVSVGETVVSVTVDGVKAECSISVVGIPVESVELSENELALTKGETAKLTAVVLPENADNRTVTWTTEDKSVATVDAEGLVTAVGAGTTVIKASAGNVSAECNVTVSGIPVESIKLDKTSLDLTEGQTAQLNATVLPENADDKTVTWSTSDDGVATVSASGLVTAVAAGNAVITAKAGGLSATCNVTVASAQSGEPKVGDYYYSDGTFSTVLDGSKEAIAIVFYVGQHPNDKSDYSATGIGSATCNAYAVALANSGKLVEWGPMDYSYMNDENYIVGTAPLDETGNSVWDVDEDTDWNGYLNTQKIKAVAETTYSGLNPDSLEGFPATYYAVNYMEAPAASSGWFLPSVSQIIAMYEASYSSDAFKIDSFKSMDSYGTFWASSEDGWNGAAMFAYFVSVSDGNPSFNSDYKDSANQYVRPVIAF